MKIKHAIKGELCDARCVDLIQDVGKGKRSSDEGWSSGPSARTGLVCVLDDHEKHTGGSFIDEEQLASLGFYNVIQLKSRFSKMLEDETLEDNIRKLFITSESKKFSQCLLEAVEALLL